MKEIAETDEKMAIDIFAAAFLAAGPKINSYIWDLDIELHLEIVKTNNFASNFFWNIGQAYFT